MSRFNVKWRYTCYMCKCPLDIYIDDWSGGIEFLDRLETFYHFKPFCFYKNVAYMKIINLHMRNLCCRCYCSYKNKQSWVKQLQHREITGRMMKTRYDKMKPYTQEEILEWFKDFNTFQSRNDVEEYTLDDSEFEGIPGLGLTKYSRFIIV